MSKRMAFGWNGAESRKRRKLKERSNIELQGQLEQSLDDDEEKQHNALEEWMRRQASASVLRLEDSASLSLRKQEEACVKAEAGKLREALSKLQEAIELTPDKAVLYELQAQCFLELDMVFEAVRAAEIAVQKEPSFGEGYQTLGRAQMNLGEVEMAVESFKKALEIDPETLKEIKEKDLPWALELLEKKNKLLGLHSESHAASRDGETSHQTTLRAVIDGSATLKLVSRI
mmetsp:Transcript_25396/g.39819  ORF Transcript_25396/g.39819 Transcript_25396/m.39819 type:complete len:231 (+) Transcript_25396:293-985(+)